MFTLCQNGFHLKFENGWTVSVQWGVHNYCNNRCNEGEIKISETAEVAAWDNENNWYNFGSDEVKGYQTANQVAEFINLIKNK